MNHHLSDTRGSSLDHEDPNIEIDKDELFHGFSVVTKIYEEVETDVSRSSCCTTTLAGLLTDSGDFLFILLLYTIDNSSVHRHLHQPTQSDVLSHL